jgi:filamentous hemagglutinin
MAAGEIGISLLDPNPEIGAVESGVWKLNPFQRGQQVEQALGHNLPSNFPVIDRFESGLATSIKSLDLNAAAYQNTSTLNRTLNGYVDTMAGFQGRTWAGVRIRPQDITGRALDLAVPHSGSAAQQVIINQTVTYGASRGVTVNIIPFP